MRKAIRNAELLKRRVPAIEDAAHQDSQLLGAQRLERSIRAVLEYERAVRARLEQWYQKRIVERRRSGVEIGHAQNLGLNAVTSCIVAAQVVGRAGNDALAGLASGIDAAIGACRPRHKQQLDLAVHASAKDRAQQLDVAKGLGMRREIGRKIDHAIELVGLVQVLQQLVPGRGSGRPIALGILRGHDLHMVPRERLGAKVVIDIRSIANNQHFHRALPSRQIEMMPNMRIVRCQRICPKSLRLF